MFAGTKSTLITYHVDPQSMWNFTGFCWKFSFAQTFFLDAHLSWLIRPYSFVMLTTHGSEVGVFSATASTCFASWRTQPFIPGMLITVVTYAIFCNRWLMAFSGSFVVLRLLVSFRFRRFFNGMDFFLWVHCLYLCRVFFSAAL